MKLQVANNCAQHDTDNQANEKRKGKICSARTDQVHDKPGEVHEKPVIIMGTLCQMSKDELSRSTTWSFTSSLGD